MKVQLWGGPLDGCTVEVADEEDSVAVAVHNTPFSLKLTKSGGVMYTAVNAGVCYPTDGSAKLPRNVETYSRRNARPTFFDWDPPIA